MGIVVEDEVDVPGLVPVCGILSAQGGGEKGMRGVGAQLFRGEGSTAAFMGGEEEVCGSFFHSQHDALCAESVYSL